MKAKFTTKIDKDGRIFSEDIDLSMTCYGVCHHCGKRLDPKSMISVFSDGYYISKDEDFIAEQNDGAYVQIELGPICALNMLRGAA